MLTPEVMYIVTYGQVTDRMDTTLWNKGRLNSNVLPLVMLLSMGVSSAARGQY